MEVSPIGDWSLNREGRWVYDANAPAANISATQMMPATSPDDPVDVPPRVDDWCEDRDPGELTDDDERE